jgi:hypothetical protein
MMAIGLWVDAEVLLLDIVHAASEIAQGMAVPMASPNFLLR